MRRSDTEGGELEHEEEEEDEDEDEEDYESSSDMGPDTEEFQL